MCLFVCTVTDFSAVEKDSGAKLHTLVYPGCASHILVNFGLGASPPEADNRNRTWEKITPGKKIAFSPQFSSRGSVGSWNWVPYGGICVLVANAPVLIDSCLPVCNFDYYIIIFDVLNI